MFRNSFNIQNGGTINNGFEIFDIFNFHFVFFVWFWSNLHQNARFIKIFHLRHILPQPCIPFTHNNCKWLVLSQNPIHFFLIIKKDEFIHSDLAKYLHSTLVISNSKGLIEILRDIRTSTYQICRIEEKIIQITTFTKYVCNWTLEVRDILKILWKRGEIALLLDFHV